MSDLETFLADVAQSQFGWPESLRFTYDKTRELLAAGVDGCLVECGVAAGAHPAVMARACIDAGARSVPVHLFDSFEGIPHGGPHDVEWNKHWGDGSGRLESSGVTAAPEAAVRANLKRWGVQAKDEWWPFWFHPGWFQDTVPAAATYIGPIAFLRLDGDLYESTKVCLEHLYPLVVAGGVVVVDDWNLDGCRAAVLDYLPHPPGVPIHEITASGDVWWTKP